DIAPSLRKIGRLQFDADALAAHLDGTINLAADAKERRQHGIAGVAPKVDTPLDYVELQRRDMNLVLFVATATILQGARLVDIGPDGRGVALPDLDRIPIATIGRRREF